MNSERSSPNHGWVSSLSRQTRQAPERNQEKKRGMPRSNSDTINTHSQPRVVGTEPPVICWCLCLDFICAEEVASDRFGETIILPPDGWPEK